jgi:co-chaperonin GroES (HSP10)
VSDGGIHIVYDEDFKEDIGVVAFTGPGKRYGCKDCGSEHVKEVLVKPGDKVLFSTNGHQITTVNGEEFVVLREPSIIAVLEDACAR